MSGAVRTQVYFTRELRDGLDARASAEGKTLAEVVREAAGTYLADGTVMVPLPGPLREQLAQEARRSGREEGEVVTQALEEHFGRRRANGAAVRAVMERFAGSDPDFSIPARDEGAHRDPWA